MEKNILLVDDDEKLKDLISKYLEEKGFEISVCGDIDEAERIVECFIFDLIILDRMLPGGDGIDLIKKIKQIYDIPILLLTALGESKERITGLKIGAEDYLSKPFEPEELYLRINSIIKRSDYNNKNIQNINFGEYKFDIKKLILKRNNDNIYLTENEKNLIYILAKNINNVVLREELSENDLEESDLRKIDVQITRLRQKIEKNPKKPLFIQTIRGKGYRLVTD